MTFSYRSLPLFALVAAFSLAGCAVDETEADDPSDDDETLAADEGTPETSEDAIGGTPPRAPSCVKIVKETSVGTATKSVVRNECVATVRVKIQQTLSLNRIGRGTTCQTITPRTSKTFAWDRRGVVSHYVALCR